MKYYLYNPLANNGIKPDIPGVDLIDASKIDYPEFFDGLNEEDEVVMVGGDGTINYLINHVDCEKIKKVFGWQPRWHMEKCMEMVCRFSKVWLAGGDVPAEMDREIEDFLNS